MSETEGLEELRAGESARYRPPAKYVPAVIGLSERIIAAARPAARDCGYALAVHGSLARDVDLLAFPWVEEATDAATVAEAIRAAIAEEIGDTWFNHDADTAQPNKPHGRSAYTLTGFGVVTTPNGQFPFVDLSVAPRLLDLAQAGASRPHVKEAEENEHVSETCQSGASRPVGGEELSDEERERLADVARRSGKRLNDWISAALLKAADEAATPSRPLGDREEDDPDRSQDEWRALLRGRDEFIVANGLWQDFAAQLPGKAPDAAAPTPSGVRERLSLSPEEGG